MKILRQKEFISSPSTQLAYGAVRGRMKLDKGIKYIKGTKPYVKVVEPFMNSISGVAKSAKDKAKEIVHNSPTLSRINSGKVVRGVKKYVGEVTAPDSPVLSPIAKTVNEAKRRAVSYRDTMHKHANEPLQSAKKGLGKFIQDPSKAITAAVGATPTVAGVPFVKGKLLKAALAAPDVLQMGAISLATKLVKPLIPNKVKEGAVKLGKGMESSANTVINSKKNIEQVNAAKHRLAGERQATATLKRKIGGLVGSGPMINILRYKKS